VSQLTNQSVIWLHSKWRAGYEVNRLTQKKHSTQAVRQQM